VLYHEVRRCSAVREGVAKLPDVVGPCMDVATFWLNRRNRQQTTVVAQTSLSGLVQNGRLLMLLCFNVLV